MATRITVKLSIALLSTAVALAGAELYLEHAFPVRKMNLRLDDELLFAPIPGSRRILDLPAEAGGARILIRINSDGYRGRELAQPKDRPRIAVYGDSIAMAENVHDDETFTERLGVHLKGSHEVVNAGVSGYGPDQALKKLLREVDALQPDLVLLVLCAHNDFGDLMRNKMFLVDDDGALVDSEYSIGATLADKFARLEAEAAAPALLRTLRALGTSMSAQETGRRRPGGFPYMNMYLYGLGGQGGLLDEYRQHVERRDSVVYAGLQDYYDADLALFPQWESSLYKRRLAAAVLRRLRQECEQRGISLAAVVVPSAVDLDPGFQIQVDRAEFPGYDPRRLTSTWMEVLEEVGIPALQLFDLLEGNNPATLFASWRDVHWNARCQELAAAHVARFLAAEGLLPR